MSIPGEELHTEFASLFSCQAPKYLLGVDGENEGSPCETMLNLPFEIIGTGVEFRPRRFSVPIDPVTA